MRNLLEAPHLHPTLTTDDALRPFFYADRALLNDLLQVAPQAVQAVLTDLYSGVRVGMIYTPHTFGRDLGFKPHPHLVTTKGGLKDDAWVEIVEVPGGRLAAKWRYLLFQRLRERRPHDAALQRVIAQTYVDHHGFQVYTESFIPKASMPHTLRVSAAIWDTLRGPSSLPIWPLTMVSKSRTGTSTRRQR